MVRLYVDRTKNIIANIVLYCALVISFSVITAFTIIDFLSMGLSLFDQNATESWWGILLSVASIVVFIGSCMYGIKEDISTILNRMGAVVKKLFYGALILLSFIFMLLGYTGLILLIVGVLQFGMWFIYVMLVTGLTSLLIGVLTYIVVAAFMRLLSDTLKKVLVYASATIVTPLNTALLLFLIVNNIIYTVMRIDWYLWGLLIITMATNMFLFYWCFYYLPEVHKQHIRSFVRDSTLRVSWFVFLVSILYVVFSFFVIAFDTLNNRVLSKNNSDGDGKGVLSGSVFGTDDNSVVFYIFFGICLLIVIVGGVNFLRFDTLSTRRHANHENDPLFGVSESEIYLTSDEDDEDQDDDDGEEEEKDEEKSEHVVQIDFDDEAADDDGETEDLLSDQDDYVVSSYPENMFNESKIESYMNE